MLYEVTVYGEQGGQQCINRFTYNSSGTPAAVTGSFALVSAMGFIDVTAGDFDADTLAKQWQYIASAAYQFDNVICRALYSVTDFYERPFVTAVVGDQSGTALSPTNAFGFRSNRVRTDVQRGYKRLAGVVENANGADGVVDSAFFPSLADMADLFSEVLSYDDEGNILTFTPCVLSLQPYDPDTGLPDPDGRARRIYPTLAEQLDHAAIGVLWEPYDTIRTQVSRQYGRGR